MGFLLYVPILNREYLAQIPTDNFSDKLGLVVLVGGGCICHHLTVEETGEVKAAEVRELNWFILSKVKLMIRVEIRIAAQYHRKSPTKKQSINGLIHVDVWIDSL